MSNGGLRRGLRDFPGVAEGAFGLAGRPDEFRSLADEVRSAYGIPYRNIARDYWLTACLHGIACAAGPDGLINKRRGSAQEPLARCAFAGGTSLVSAWRITERYSEDLDVLALILDEGASATARKKPLSVVAKWACDHIEVGKDDIRFKENSQAQQALRNGYQQVDQLAWGGVLPFENALERAAALDS